MKAAVLTRTGPAGSFEIRDVDPPTPAPDQLLVRVAACGVCGHDVLARRGLLAAGAGQILGHEIAGVVAAVGADVEPGWLGRRVALVQRLPCGTCRYCRKGRTNLCRSGPGFYGEDLAGGYAEYVVAGPSNAAVLPDSVDDAAGAILSCAVGTGLHALRRGRVGDGDVVLVTGATGGVGLHAVQLAAAFGARVIALTRDPMNEDRLVAAGAARVVPAAEGADGVRRAARHLQGTVGVDLAIETTGTPTFAVSVRSLAPGGRLVVVGNTDPGAASLVLGPVIVKELEIIGSAHADRKELQDVIDMVTSGTVVATPAQSWPLDEVAAAHAAVESGEAIGRAVVRP